MEYSDALPADVEAIYMEKLKLSGLSICPYKIPIGNFIYNPLLWPFLEYPNLYDYLMSSPGPHRTLSKFSRKGCESYRYYTEGWVNKVKHFVTDSGSYLFLTKVAPQQIANDLHLPWVVLSHDGQVIACHCNCITGLNETCSHIGAVLWFIEATCRLGPGDDCTQFNWDDSSSKNVKPGMDKDVDFYGESSLNHVKLVDAPYDVDAIKPPSDEQKMLFLQKIFKDNINECPVICSAFEETCSPFINQ